MYHIFVKVHFSINHKCNYKTYRYYIIHLSCLWCVRHALQSREIKPYTLHCTLHFIEITDREEK